jgi:hypothetical protein
MRSDPLAMISCFLWMNSQDSAPVPGTVAEMFCARCGSQIDANWVACPHCGQRYQTISEEGKPDPYTHPSSDTWYPNKHQWWAIWATAPLIVLGLMNGSDGMMFAISAVIVGGLIVWKLQRPGGE